MNGNKLRILSIISNPPSWTAGVAMGGGERTNIEILKRWYSWGVYVETLESHPPPSVILDAKYSVGTIRLFRGIPSFINLLIFSILCAWKAVFDHQKFDVVIAACNNLTDVCPAWIISRLSKKRLIIFFVVSSYGCSLSETYKSMREEGSAMKSLLKAFAGLVMLQLARHASALCCISGPVADMLERIGYSPNRIHVTGMGVAPDAFNSVPAMNNKFDGVFLGRVEKEKGVEDLLEAWKFVVNQKPSVKLLIVGSGGYLENAKRYVQENKLEDNVKFLGFISSNKRFSYLKSSKISIYPTKIHEGWPQVIGESLACGLPVISYDTPVVKNSFDKCDSVFLVTKDDIKGLVHVILRLLNEESSIEELGKISKSYARKFDWDLVAKRALNVVRDIVNKSEQ